MGSPPPTLVLRIPDIGTMEKCLNVNAKEHLVELIVQAWIHMDWLDILDMYLDPTAHCDCNICDCGGKQESDETIAQLCDIYPLICACLDNDYHWRTLDYGFGEHVFYNYRILDNNSIALLT